MNNPFRTASEEDRRGGAYVCACCQRPWDVCVPPAEFGGGAPPGTCPACLDHVAFAMQRDRDHIALWRSLTQAEQQEHAAEAARLQARVSELEQQLRDLPEKVVDRYVDQQELDDARAEAERAFRSRENAWQALCEIRLIHREGEAGRCRCGTRLDSCKVALIVDRYPGLEQWEKEQVRRLRNYQDHKLPDGHPAVIDPRWQP